MRIARHLLLAAPLIFASFLCEARDAEVLARFLETSRELRSHRAEMLSRFAQEQPLVPQERSKGLRLYFRWAPPNREQLRNLSLTFESEDQVSHESIAIREELNWGLKWYSALLPQPKADIGVLRIKADVESKHFRTPFQSIREVTVFEGTLPLVLSSLSGPLRIIVELDSDSPFAERKQSGRALKLSLLPKEVVGKEARAR